MNSIAPTAGAPNRGQWRFTLIQPDGIQRYRLVWVFDYPVVEARMRQTHRIGFVSEQDSRLLKISRRPRRNRGGAQERFHALQFDLSSATWRGIPDVRTVDEVADHYVREGFRVAARLLVVEETR